MFTTSDIISCFDQLVGWRNSSKSPTCFDDLTAELQNSTSGFYVNAIEGIELSIIDEMISEDQVDLNTYLANVHQDSAIDLVHKFSQLQKEKLNTKSLLSNLNIGTRVLDIRRLVTDANDRFVGFEIRPYESNNVNIQATEIGIQLDTVQTLDIYFYSSTQITPISVTNIDITTANTVNWFALSDVIASYNSQTQGSGAHYYIGYYESDLVGTAIFTELPCGSCSNSPKKKYGKYFALNPMEVSTNETYLDKSLFDTENIGYTTDTFGLHLKVNATCDVSDVLCTNKNLFASALQKSIAIRLFWDLYNSERINRMTVLNKSDARLNAERLELQLEEEMKTLNIDFTGVDAVCQGCRRKSYGSFQIR
jgi:hypothetical protein